MATLDVSEMMRDIPKYFNPEAAKGVEVSVQCTFTGEQASDWALEIYDQTCTVREGKTDDPDFTIKADAEVGVKVLTGQMDPMRAYMLGKIKVNGDLAQGMKLVKLFKN